MHCCYLELGPFFARCGSLFPTCTLIHASSCPSPTKTSECSARAVVTILCSQQNLPAQAAEFRLGYSLLNTPSPYTLLLGYIAVQYTSSDQIVCGYKLRTQHVVHVLSTEHQSFVNYMNSDTVPDKQCFNLPE